MSVVNQMLRDLDRRQAGEESAVYTQHLRPVDADRRKPLITIGIVILIAIAAIYAGLQYVDRPEPAAPPVEIAETIQPAATPIAIEPIPVAARTEQTTPVAEAAIAEPVAATIDEAASTVRPIATDEPAAAAKLIVALAPDAQAQATTHTPPRHSRESGSSGIAAPAAQTSLAVEPDTSATKIDVRPHAQPIRSAESEFRRAATLLNQARSEEARAALKTALELDARHEGARQTLAVLLIEARAMNEAEALLTEGLKLNPNQSNFAIVLARLKLDHGDTAGALQVLREHGAAAVNNAEYRAFAAALLQRMNRHPEALDEYRAALTLSPNVGVWWVGLGLSFEATGESTDAAEAFMRARATGTLSADVAQFVEHKLQTLH